MMLSVDVEIRLCRACSAKAADDELFRQVRLIGDPVPPHLRCEHAPERQKDNG